MADLAALKQRGNAAFAAGRFEQADACYSEALRLLAAKPAGSDGVATTLLANRAATRLRLGDPLGALVDTVAALQLDGRHAKGWYRKALALQELGRLPEALAAARQCLDLTAGIAQREAQQLLAALEDQAAQQPEPGATRPPPPLRLPITRTCLPLPWRASPSAWEFVPSPDGLNENLLVLLHGLGDGPSGFARLARQMRLPQTAALALAGPLEVPFTEGGRSWYQVFDEELELIQGGPVEERRLRSLEATLDALQRVLRMLQLAAGWAPHRVHLLGFSQGGTAALELALRCSADGQPLGSCVAISASLLEERLSQPHSTAHSGAWQEGQNGGGGPSCSSTIASEATREAGLPPLQPPGQGQQTPVLVTHGTADGVLPRRLVERSVQFMRSAPGIGEVELVSVPGKKHGMVQSEGEMRELMAFWSRHLGRRPVGQDRLPAGLQGEDLIEVRPEEVSIEQLPPGAAAT